MTTIELYVTAQGWMARSNDPQTRELFGTDTIPTAFTCNAHGSKVLAEIQKLNPEAIVYLLNH